MAWLAKLFKAVEAFAEHAYKKPIWIIMTSIVLVVCVPFLASYQSSRPEEQARFENAINERQVEIEDSERMVDLLKEIDAERGPATTVTGKFSSITQDMLASGRWTDRKQQIQEIYQLAVETRKRVEILIAKQQGINFRVTYLNEKNRSVEGFLRLVANTMKLIEDICTPYLIGEVEKFAQSILQGNSRIDGVIREGKTVTFSPTEVQS